MGDTLIAILAHDPEIAASYNLGLTLLSLLIGALIAGVGLMVALLDFGRWTPALGGAIVGCGAAATHYTGMLALQLPGRLTWLPELALRRSCSVWSSRRLRSSSRQREMIGPARRWQLVFLRSRSSLQSSRKTCGVVRSRSRYGRLVVHLSLARHLSVATVILGMCLVEAWSARHSQAELRTQKYLLDTALKNMPQGLCMFEADGRIMLFNDRYAELMGLSAAALKGLSLLDIFKLRKASGRLASDPQAYFEGILAELHVGRSSKE